MNLTFARCIRVLSLVLAASLLTGCLQVKAYVDPKVRKTEYAALQKPATPRQLVLVTEFTSRGAKNGAADSLLRSQAERVLAQSGLFKVVPANTQDTDRLVVKVDNYGDVPTGSAVGTGLTFGAVGTTAVDKYAMTAVYTPAGGSAITKRYDHSITSTIGNASAPDGLLKMNNIDDAFGRVVEDMLLSLLSDLQQPKQVASK